MRAPPKRTQIPYLSFLFTGSSVGEYAGPVLYTLHLGGLWVSKLSAEKRGGGRLFGVSLGGFKIVHHREGK